MTTQFTKKTVLKIAGGLILLLGAVVLTNVIRGPQSAPSDDYCASDEARTAVQTLTLKDSEVSKLPGFVSKSCSEGLNAIHYEFQSCPGDTGLIGFPIEWPLEQIISDARDRCREATT